MIGLLSENISVDKHLISKVALRAIFHECLEKVLSEMIDPIVSMNKEGTPIDHDDKSDSRFER